MRREKGCREKKAGKRLLTSISCLLLLSGMVMLFTYMIGEEIGEKEDRAEGSEISAEEQNTTELNEISGKKESNSKLRQAGGFDNPIDDLYLPIIFESGVEDKTEVLADYERAWREQFEEYLEDYASRCNYARDKEMVEDYLAAIQWAVDAQKEMMAYMEVEEEKQLWYSAQIYRCAFTKDIGGKFASEGMGKDVMDVGVKEVETPAMLDYEVWGEFDNDIDSQYVTSMYEGSQVEIKAREEEFNLAWCNELGELTLEFYENLDDEGKKIAGIWQESRENWKSVADPRIWSLPEELNAEEEDYLFWGNGTSAGLMEKNGWIDRLYYLQLQSMMETEDKAGQKKCSRVICRITGRSDHRQDALEISGQKVLLDIVLEAKDKMPLSIYPLEEGAENDCEQIWQICSEILGEKDADAWKHYTWYMKDEDTGERMEEGMVLYRIKSGEQGFFFMREGSLCHVRMDDIVDRDNVKRLKEKIESLNEREKVGKSRWEKMLWAAWEGKLPDDGLYWEDEKIKEEVYNEISYSRIVPSREEIMELSALEIENAEQVKTFGDLKNLPHLTSLTLVAYEEINYDINGDMVPELEELFFRNIPLEQADFLEKLPDLKVLGMLFCNLTDLSFLEKYPHLTEVSFFGNEISDISPLANCKDLEVISLANNNVADISPLSGLPKLREVGLQGNRITDIGALESLDGLEEVNLNSNQIVDLSPLEKLTGLTCLGAADNLIKDITPLKGLNQIYNLSLDANEISNIDPLSNMKEMEYLGLSGNLIEDYTPIKGMENLYSLSVTGNPGQDIGKLVFAPEIFMGNAEKIDNGKLEKMQAYLDLYYSQERAMAEDFAEGDIDGDGIEDIAITGLVDAEEGSDWESERYVYPLISQGDGSFIPLPPVESLGPYMGGVYGDPYQGIIITDHMLVIQVYGGSNWRWGSTHMYQYEEGEMKEKWEKAIAAFVMTPGMNFSIYDKENNFFKKYLIVGEAEEHKEFLLIDEDNGQPDPRRKEFDALLMQFKDKIKISFPEVYPEIVEPELDGWFDYHICSYSVTREPAWVLEKVAGKVLEDAMPIPAVYYTSEEIRESYQKLIGVQPPEMFYMGLIEREPVIMYYNGCIQYEDGFVHEIVLRKSDEEGKYWKKDCCVYYDESTGIYILKDKSDD